METPCHIGQARKCLTTIRSLRGNGLQICPFRIGGHSVLTADDEATGDVADIYNQAGDDYVSYADGDPSQPFAFDGMHAYADRCVWAVLEKKVTDLRASAKLIRSSMRVADPVPGYAGWSYTHMRSDSAALPRADSTSHRRKYTGPGWRPEIFPAFLE